MLGEQEQETYTRIVLEREFGLISHTVYHRREQRHRYTYHHFLISCTHISIAGSSLGSKMQAQLKHIVEGLVQRCASGEVGRGATVLPIAAVIGIVVGGSALFFGAVAVIVMQWRSTSYKRRKVSQNLGLCSDEDVTVTMRSRGSSEMPRTSPSVGSERRKIIEEEEMIRQPEEIDYTKTDFHTYVNISASLEFDGSRKSYDQEIESKSHQNDVGSIQYSTLPAGYNTEEDGDEQGELITFENTAVQDMQGSVLISQIKFVKGRGSLVNIPKRISSAPSNNIKKSDFSEQGG